MKLKRFYLFLTLLFSLFYISENHIYEQPVFVEQCHSNILLLKAKSNYLEKTVINSLQNTSSIAENRDFKDIEDFNFITPIPIKNLYNEALFLYEKPLYYYSYQFSSILFRYKSRVLRN